MALTYLNIFKSSSLLRSVEIISGNGKLVKYNVAQAHEVIETFL